MNNLKIIVAGPGAGKTYNLKKTVIDCLPNLDNNRFCAVVTYTNAATEELRRRISSDVPIPPNVFIGTIHSFLICFVIEPYGHFIKLPSEKNYIEDVSLPYDAINQFAEKAGKQKIARELSQKGILAYDMVIEQAKKILETYPSLTCSIGNRLQYIFIDEYQDSRIYIHQIFEMLLSTNQPMITVIGDPLQSVFRFSYIQSLVAGEDKTLPKSYTETPMMLYKASFREGVDTILSENLRSSMNIVDFINRFHIANARGKQKTSNHNEIPIYFIKDPVPSEIITRYKQLKDKHNIDALHEEGKKRAQKIFPKDFYLTHHWIKADSDKDKLKALWGILCGEAGRLEKGLQRNNGTLQEISRLVLAITGVKRKDFIQSDDDEINYRRFCFAVARYLRSEKFDKGRYKTSIRNSFQKGFHVNLDNDGEKVDVQKFLDEFLNISFATSATQQSYYSTIHSAKGLEATSVLAIAYSNKEMQKWLDFEAANSNIDDDYRLGYVAFSRARDMLCIACLEELSAETKAKLDSLGVVVYPNSV